MVTSMVWSPEPRALCTKSGCQEPHDFEVVPLARDAQRIGAVLAGTPVEDDVLTETCHHLLRYDATNFSRSVSPESKNLNRLIPLRLRV